MAWSNFLNLSRFSNGMARMPVCLVACLIGLASTLADAQVYACTDANGKVFISDKRIPECLDRVQKEMGNSGVVRRQILPETHQSRVASQAGSTNTEANEKALRQARQQRALLDRYADEASHNVERKRALATVEEGIAYLTTQTSNQLASSKRLAGEVAMHKAKNEATPSALQQQLNENQSLLELLKQQLQERQQERLRINQRYDAELYLLRQAWDQAGMSKR